MTPLVPEDSDDSSTAKPEGRGEVPSPGAGAEPAADARRGLRPQLRAVSPETYSAMLDEVIVGGHLSVVFQPIVIGRTRRVLGYEALVRCPVKFFDSTQELLTAVTHSGRAGEFGRLVRDLATRACPHAALFLNVLPNEFDDPWLVRPDDPIFRHKHPVYLEIVESVPLEFFDQCHSVLGEIRKKGIRLAIDDFGAGYSNVGYIADLDPEIVKFDRMLVAGLTMNSRRFDLVRSLVRLCGDMGAEVVAEGVETVNEFGAVLRAGADYCQGYFFGYPGRPDPIDRV